MVKTYHFMAGLPRSGSTLLKSLIDQNPNIHTEPVSPVMELMYHTEEYFKNSIKDIKNQKMHTKSLEVISRTITMIGKKR
jgi:sulfotransferase